MATLERWRADALSTPARERAWTAAARLQAVIATASMDEAQLSAWCREQGVYPTELQQWKRDAIAALGEPSDVSVSAQEVREDRKRIKELERDLRRKDKALAETAALLVLSKQMEAIFRRGEVEAVALALYRFGAAHAEARGIILADTKFELGVSASSPSTSVPSWSTPSSNFVSARMIPRASACAAPKR